MAALPVPVMLWYVLTTPRWMQNASCRGLERHHELHRRAIRVGDDAVIRADGVTIDFWHHERTIRIHAPGTAVVNDGDARLGKLGRPLLGHIPASTEQSHLRPCGQAPPQLSSRSICGLETPPPCPRSENFPQEVTHPRATPALPSLRAWSARRVPSLQLPLILILPWFLIQLQIPTSHQ